MALQWLKHERERHGWTQDQVAVMLGTTQVNVSRWENGPTTPSLHYREKLRELFGKSDQELELFSVSSNGATKQISASLNPTISRINWGDAPHPYQFYGREAELFRLKQWIVDERCRIVAIVGLGGIGKTSLAAVLAEQIQNTFTFIFWYSLQYAPPLEQFLQSCLQFLSDNTRLNLPEDVDTRFSLLLSRLRENRCLIVLDNVETILQTGEGTGFYREEYEGYGKLFRRIGEGRHLSCLLLTSREKPGEIAFLEGNTLPVRSYRLEGLDANEGGKILKVKGLNGEDEILEKLVNLYGGNPLSLKLIAELIRDVFAGNIANFIAEGETLPIDVREVLDQQFDRLSTLEEEIMYWLALKRETASIKTIQESMISQVSIRAFQEALRSLKRRDLIETPTEGFELQPVVMDYVTDRFVEYVHQEIKADKLALFAQYPLMEAEAKEYVREIQEQFILGAVARRLLATMDEEDIKVRVISILSDLRNPPSQHFDYTAGNLLNLLIYLKYELRNFDFSQLSIWQAYLQDVDLQGVNFAYSQFSKSIFTDTFGSVFSLTFSPIGERFATGTVNGIIRLWNSASATPICIYQGHTQWVFALAFNPTGDILASGSGDKSICLWDVNSNLRLGELKGHSSWVRSVAFSPDGRMLASGSEDRTIRLWDVKTWRCINVLNGHDNRVSSVAFSPDGRMLASGSEDQTIRLWDVSMGKCLKIIKGHSKRVSSIDFNPNNSELLTSGSEDDLVRLWETKQEHCLKIFQGHSNRIRSVAFSPDGNTIASGSEDRTVRLWNVNDEYDAKILYGHTDTVRSVTFSPDSMLLVSGGDDKTLCLWDTNTGTRLKTFKGHSKRVRMVDFSVNGNVLVSCSEDETICLWDIDTGENFKTLRGHTDKVWCVAFRPDGKILASGSEDETVRLWDVNAGENFKTLRGHTDRIWCIAFSPDGRILASSSDDRTIRLWNLCDGHQIETISNTAYNVRAIGFSPDGQLLALGSHDGTINLWDLKTRKYRKGLRTKGPYERMNIFKVEGLTKVQIATLKDLGAVEEE